MLYGEKLSFFSFKISFTKFSGTETVEEKIVLDRNIDVPEEIGTFYRCTYLDYKTENKEEIKKKVPFKYDNELKVTLIHGEYRIYEFRPKNDEEGSALEIIKSTTTKNMIDDEIKVEHEHAKKEDYLVQ